MSAEQDQMKMIQELMKQVAELKAAQAAQSSLMVKKQPKKPRLPSRLAVQQKQMPVSMLDEAQMKEMKVLSDKLDAVALKWQSSNPRKYNALKKKLEKKMRVVLRRCALNQRVKVKQAVKAQDVQNDELKMMRQLFQKYAHLL